MSRRVPPPISDADKIEHVALWLNLQSNDQAPLAISKPVIKTWKDKTESARAIYRRMAARILEVDSTFYATLICAQAYAPPAD